MRYGAMENQQVASPFQGRGTGVRHSGGGDMTGKKGQTPTPPGGYAQGPSGGLMIGGYNPSPGSLSSEPGMLSESWRPDSLQGLLR